MIAAGLLAVRVHAQDDEAVGPVVFASDRSGDYEIYTLDPDTGTISRLTDDPAADLEPVWSPDGETIAFVSDRDGDFEIFVMRADGTNVQQLTNNAAEDRMPRWQPGGMYLIYSSDVNGQWDIYSISADGAVVRQLTNDPFDERGPVAAGGVVQPGPTGTPATPSQPGTAAPGAVDARVNARALNVRSNPGEGATILEVVPNNTPLDIIGKWTTDTWLQVVTPSGKTGWVFAELITINIDLSGVPVVNAPFIVPPTNTPIPPSPTVGVVPVTISFSVYKDTITAGQCVTFTWFVEGIKEVYYQNQGVTGSGSRQECPTTTTTYNLRVVRMDNVVDNRYITITVNPA
jgi:uncharacterized protein YraI